MKGEHIVRFPLGIKSWKNKPDLNKHPHVKDDQALWGFFVRTAPGNLAANINPPIKLANGTPVEYHSIYWEDEELNDLYRELERNTPPGELITMPEEPTAINVIVNPSDSKFRSEWKHATLVKGDAVISVIPTPWKTNTYNFTISSGVGYGYSKVSVVQKLMVDMSFSVTFYKVQGRTIPKLITALGERPKAKQLHKLDHPSLLVSLSRIKDRENMRILAGVNDNLDYLTQLKPSPYLIDWWSGFIDKETGGVWSSSLMLEARKKRLQSLEPKKKNINTDKNKRKGLPFFHNVKRRKIPTKKQIIDDPEKSQNNNITSESVFHNIK